MVLSAIGGERHHTFNGQSRHLGSRARDLQDSFFDGKRRKASRALISISKAYAPPSSSDRYLRPLSILGTVCRCEYLEMVE